MKNKNGFTFVELLVVITIIAVLTAVAAVTYTSTMQKSRNARRLSDIQIIRSALEICRSEDGIYPAAVTAGAAITCTSGSVPLKAVPTGPKGGTDVYTYVRGANPFKTYTLSCTLEGGGTCSYTEP